MLERLLKEGHEVVGLDNLLTGHRSNIEPWLSDFEFIEGDIRDLDTCHRAAKGADYVLHQAALGSVPRSVEDPILSHTINTTGTLNVLVAARDAEVSGVGFAASSSYFGDTDVLPKTDDMPPRPLSPYAVTKVTCEHYMQVFSKVYGLPTVGLRYFNVFGPRQDPNGPYAAVIPKFVDILLDGRAPTIDGDGGQTRDFTYIDNVVQANLQAMKHAERASGHIMNVACGGRIDLNTLYRLITKELGIERDPVYGPPRVGDVRDSMADISTAQRLIDFQPSIELEEGLTQTVAWFKDKHGA